MIIFLAILVILIYGFNIYLIVNQIAPSKKLSKHDKVIWSILLIIVPLLGLWFYNYINSKLPGKNIFRY